MLCVHEQEESRRLKCGDGCGEQGQVRWSNKGGVIRKLAGSRRVNTAVCNESVAKPVLLRGALAKLGSGCTT